MEKQPQIQKNDGDINAKILCDLFSNSVTWLFYN